MDTITIDRVSDTKGPKYKRVSDTIRQAVANGALKTGTKLPPVRDLAYQLGITPGTVARAYTILTNEGVLEAEVGRGTFVAAQKTRVPDDVWSRQLDLSGAVDTGTISLFSPRLPDVGQVSAIRDALKQVAQGPALGFLNYPTRAAYQPAREAVVNWLSDLPLGPLSSDDIVLTHGGQSGLNIVFQTILKGPHPTLLVEDLTYAGFRRAADLLRADVVGVDIDENGILPASLDAAARRTGAQLVCVSPEVHNPTGQFMPLERRKEIVAVAERRGLQIVEDDCYRMGEAHAPSFRALAPDRGWHVSSISKLLTPALRVGFAIAPKGQHAELRRSAEHGYFGLAYPLAELTRILLSDPDMRRVSQQVRHRIADYVRVAVNELGGFDLRWNAEVPFVWLRLPSGWRAAAFTRAAETAGVQLRSADEFALRDGRAPHAVRIAINAQVPIDRFADAMRRLHGLLDNPPEQISV